MSLALAVACSLAFSLTNGFHDAHRPMPRQAWRVPLRI